MNHSKVLIGFLLLAVVAMIGCVATTEQTVAPVDQARVDSIANAQRDSLLRLNRMYAYDYLKRGEWDRARGFLWKLVELDEEQKYNDWARVYQTYIEKDDPDSAQHVIDRGLELHPEDAYLNATMGYFKKLQGDNEGALEHFKISNAVKEPKAEYVKAQAEVEESLDMGDEAIATYEKLLEMTPDDQDAKDRYTSLLRRFRDPLEYIESLKADADKNPDDLNKRLELIAAYDGQSMNEQVIEQSTIVITKDPSMKEAYHYRAKSQENLEKHQETIDTYKALLEVDAGNSDAMVRIADNYRMLNKYTSARTWCMKAHEAAGGSKASAHYVLGMTYESCVENCSGGTTNYDDKLVSIIAYGLFKKAAAGDDYDYKERASNRLTYYKQAEFIPSYSDYFMNQSKKMPGKSCYSWIKANWSEVKYINSFLGTLAKSKG